MMERMITKITNLLINHNIRMKDKELFMYGLKGLLNYGLIACIVFACSVGLNSILPSLAFVLCFVLIRTFSGGIHLNNRISCFICSIIFLVSIPLLIVNLNINHLVLLSCCVISIIWIYILAPIDHPNYLLSIHEKNVFKKKTKTVLLLISSILIIFILTKMNIKIVQAMEVGLISNFISMISALVTNKLQA